MLYAYFSDTLWALVALAIFTQAGVWLLLAMRLPHLHVLEWASAAFLLGVGAVSLQLMALGMLQIRLHLAWVAGLWLVLWVALAAWQRRTRRPWAWPQSSLKAPQPLGVVVWAALALTLMTIFFRATFHPIFEWDSWAIWDLKAKAFFYQAGLFPYIRDTYYGLSHLEYPLLFPLSATTLYLVLGRHSDVALLIPALLYACASLLLYGSLRRMGAGRELAGAGALTLAWIPNFLFWSQNFNADGPLAVYALASTLFAADYLRRPQRATALLAGLCAGMATQIKIEGVLLIAGLLPFIAWRALRRPQERTHAVLFTLGLIGIAAPWFLYQRVVSSYAGHITSNNAQTVIDNLHRLPEILRYGARWLIDWGALGGYGALIPILLVVVALSPFTVVRGLWLAQAAAALAPAVLFFLVFPQFITSDNFNRYLTTFLVVCVGAVVASGVDALRRGDGRLRLAQVVLGVGGGLILLGNLLPDFLPEARGTVIYTERPLSSLRYTLGTFPKLLSQLPHQRRELLDARAAHPPYAALLHVAASVSQPDQSVALWVTPEDQANAFLLQRSYYLLYPRKVFLVAETSELAQMPALGVVVRYDREDHPPESVPVFLPDTHFGVHLLPPSAASMREPASLIRWDAQFAEGIRLAGLQTISLTPENVLLIIWWHPQQDGRVERTVFVHAWQGETLVGQHDSPPAFGLRPTASWRAGEWIADAHLLTLPGGWQSTRICVGLYQPVDGARLSLADGTDMICRGLMLTPPSRPLAAPLPRTAISQAT